MGCFHAKKPKGMGTQSGKEIIREGSARGLNKNVDSEEAV